MNIKVRLFAAARDTAGDSVIALELADQGTVADLRRCLVEMHPKLKSMADVLLVAVNSEYAGDERVLNPSDEVACFPPVSGG